MAFRDKDEQSREGGLCHVHKGGAPVLVPGSKLVLR